jgi:hypothetical protein
LKRQPDLSRRTFLTGVAAAAAVAANGSPIAAQRPAIPIIEILLEELGGRL